MRELIVAQSLCIGYRRGPTVLADIATQIVAGEVLCIIGPNGGGKTTLLRTLSGLHPPRAGSVLLNGRPLYGRGALERRQRARRVAVVLTDHVAPAYLRVRELVSLGRLPYRPSAKADRNAVERAMEESGIAHLANRPVGELSDGERQRVMVARGLAQEPEILLLDEPAVHLDPPHQSELFLLLRDLVAAGPLQSVAIATHQLHLALHYSDRLLLVAGGSVTAGTAAEFLSDDRLERALPRERDITVSYSMPIAGGLFLRELTEPSPSGRLLPMRIRNVRRYLILPLLYVGVIFGLLFLQFSGRLTVRKEIRNLHFTGTLVAGADETSSNITAARLEFEGIRFDFSEDIPLVIASGGEPDMRLHPGAMKSRAMNCE